MSTVVNAEEYLKRPLKATDDEHVGVKMIQGVTAGRWRVAHAWVKECAYVFVQLFVRTCLGEMFAFQ